jgi:hypothetical protein
LTSSVKQDNTSLTTKKSSCILNKGTVKLGAV